MRKKLKEKKGMGIYEIIGAVLLLSMAITLFTSSLMLSMQTAINNQSNIMSQQVLKTFYNLANTAVDDADRNIVNATSGQTALDALFTVNFGTIDADKEAYYMTKVFPDEDKNPAINTELDFTVDVSIVELPSSLSAGVKSSLMAQNILTFTESDSSFWMALYPNQYGGEENAMQIGSSTFSAENITVALIRTIYASKQDASYPVKKYKIVVSSNTKTGKESITFDYYPSK